jgi:peptidoglycan/LPS O-acetylase OafA/YrhL
LSATLPAVIAATGPAVATESDRVQTLRGLACLLLVAFHVIGTDPAAGLRVDDESWYRAFAEAFRPLRMPLFTFLSGLVYAWRPLDPASSALFARKKVLRLLVPLLVVTALMVVVQSAVGASNARLPPERMWEAFVYPYMHLWFLQAMLVIFAALLALERCGLLATPRRFATVFAVIAGIHLCLPYLPAGVPRAFSIENALYLAPFFLAGLAAHRFRAFVRQPALQRAAVAAFAALITLHVLATLDVFGAPAERFTPFGLALSTSAALTLLHQMPGLRWLAWIGAYSFTIYLHHVFFTAGTRIALERAGVADLELHFVLGLVAGIAGPIAIEFAAKRHRAARRILLGQS